LEAGAPSRIKSAVSGPPLLEKPYGLVMTSCGDTPINEGPSRYATRAAVDAIAKWSADRKHAPAIGDRIRLTASTTGPVTVDRDPVTGIAIGGIRLPQVTVPVETLRGQGSSAGGFCWLFGMSDPWNGDSDPFDKQEADNPAPSPEPSLKGLYGSADQYANKVRKEANRASSSGFLLQADVAEIVNTAQRTKF
jgi:hypothetical protein